MSDAMVARNRFFVLRYYEARRDVLTSARRDDDPAPLLRQLALAALPDFADWVAVVDPAAETSFSLCTKDHDHSFTTCRTVRDPIPDLDRAIREAVASGEDVTWNNDDQGTRGVVARLVVEDRGAGAVILGRDAPNAPWTDDDLAAVHDVVTALGVDFERLRLRHQSRLALRASQRVASQLHQLISASLAVGTLGEESAIAQTLARSVRSVFDAEDAILSVGGAHELLVALAQRGVATRVLDASGARRENVPLARDRASEPWHDGEWLCAPVLDTQRRLRGMVAARRGAAIPFSDEDRELAMLLGQMAATALEALDLNRTIRDNENRLRILVDAAPVAIVESDGAGQVRWWNRSASRLLRWPDFADRPTPDPSWPEGVLSPLLILWRDLLAGGLHDTHEFRTTVGDRERQLTASAAVLPGEVGDPHVLTLIDDITDQRELREEVRHAHRMELRGQVASSIAHDFNNLITLIVGYTELLARAVAGNEKAEELVHEIQSTSSRASALTAQLQSIGRTSPPIPIRLDLGTSLRRDAEVLERIMGSSTRVHWALADWTPPVTIDADLFEQMILNLSINARDAMPDGGTLTFTTQVIDLQADDVRAPGSVAGTYVALSIADTGTGMDEATLARCFEPLFTTKGPLKGTGLGLASARRLVEESGGRITCASRPGVGTTFTVWLPAHTTDTDTEHPDQPPQRTKTRRSERVLLCEDDGALRHLASQVLRRHGFIVIEAISAEDALEVHARFSEPIDVLVSDVVLPLMTGDELARQLQSEQPDLLVVIMSGTASPDALAGLTPGSASFVAKPFKPSSLVDEITRLLATRESLRD